MHFDSGDHLLESNLIIKFLKILNFRKLQISFQKKKFY